MSAPANLIYVAYGRDDIRMQALYAAYSALAWGGDQLRVHVFTDAASAFDPIQRHLEFHDLGQDRLRALRGPGDYAFRVKIAILQEMAGKSAGPVAFVDADTFFVAPVREMFDRVDTGRAVLHKHEYHVLRHTTGQVRRFRRRMTQLSNGSLAVDGDMWNSGVIALHPDQFGVLDEILAVIDRVSPHYKKALVEQYAVSYFVARSADVTPCDDLVFHYWFQKPEYEQEIGERLTRWRQVQIDAAIEEIRRDPIRLPVPPRKVKWWEDWHSRLRFGHPLTDTRGLPR